MKQHIKYCEFIFYYFCLHVMTTQPQNLICVEWPFLTGTNSWGLVVAVVCLEVRGSPELWHASYSLQWERGGGDGGGGLCEMMGEERRGCLKKRRRRRRGGMSDSLTDLGERLLIPEGCSNVCFTGKVERLKTGRRRVLLKERRISVQSSLANLNHLFLFIFPFFFSWHRLRNIAC